jgi:tetratricopeptide (TPR) repeat protein
VKNILIISAVLTTSFAQSANAANVDFDAQHERCLEKISDDADIAYEDALIWQSEGGGRRARHCVARALNALGHPGEAASRLEKIATAPDGGTPEMRAGFYAEAANLWLDAGEPGKAHDAASAGLEKARSHLDLRIVRARAYGALGHWGFALTELTSALAFHPDNADALRARANVYLQTNDLELAKADIERSVASDSTNIETLLLRGKINEAIRLDAPLAIEIQK